MLLEPNAIVLYVEDLVIASSFYQDLLGLTPKEQSPTFHGFTLSNGMGIGLKVRRTVMPSATHENGAGELAFTVANRKTVDELFIQWQAKQLTILCSPNQLPYGYTFVALDPDGNRLRVVALRNTL